MKLLLLFHGELTTRASNAAGAFVHGMEDEMVQVRLSAVQSVHRLWYAPAGVLDGHVVRLTPIHRSEEDSTFALKALDFLVEMFNDEIEQVPSVRRFMGVKC